MASLLTLFFALAWTSDQPPLEKSGAFIPPMSTAIYPPGVRGEADYISWLRGEHDKLSSAAEQASSADPAEIWAYHANWLLAVRCEPHLTRILLGLERADDVSALVENSQAASELVERVRSASSDKIDGEKLDIVSDFARAVTQFALSKAGQAESSEMTKAASGLSLWLDDDRAEIADAALLWQSMLYREQGKIDRALALLPLPVTPVNNSTARYYARLERCAILAAQGRTALALALMLKMEERCSIWFADERRGEHAFCTITWLRLRIAQAGLTKLGETTARLKQEWLERGRESLSDAETDCHFVRLHPAIPVVFQKPVIQEIEQRDEEEQQTIEEAREPPTTQPTEPTMPREDSLDD